MPDLEPNTFILKVIMNRMDLASSVSYSIVVVGNFVFYFKTLNRQTFADINSQRYGHLKRSATSFRIIEAW